MTKSVMKVETADARMSTSTVDGMRVARTFTVSDKSGAVIAALGANAVLALSFNGVDEEEGLALARRFDWKAMQKALPKSP